METKAKIFFYGITEGGVLFKIGIELDGRHLDNTLGALAPKKVGGYAIEKFLTEEEYEKLDQEDE